MNNKSLDLGTSVYLNLIRSPLTVKMKEIKPPMERNFTIVQNNITSIQDDDYIFDRTDIRIIFITLYTAVFCCCFFGNLLVILVVTLSRRLRSVTNFFLANLAIADLCVGVFCVFQNLSIYLIPSWVFGDFLCKMYQFIHSLSYTASIFILVVICTERYLAIIHPITCKQILTPSRLRMVIAGVWMTSAIYSAPKFIWVQTITNHLGNNQTETICISHRKKYDSELFDIINFCFLYLTPLCIMLVLYTRIAVTLWESSRGLPLFQSTPASTSASQTTIQVSREKVKVNGRAMNIVTNEACCVKHAAQALPINHQFKVSLDKNSKSFSAWRRRGGNLHQFSHLSKNVIRARRGVIRMLIIVVLTFAVCNLPFHARKMWQYWSSNYQGSSDFSTLFTPLTFLITYFNSGINPLLYAFLSRNFRKGMRELLFCNCRGSQRKQKQLLPNQDSGNQLLTLLGERSGRFTRAGCSSISHSAYTSSDTGNGSADYKLN